MDPAASASGTIPNTNSQAVGQTIQATSTITSTTTTTTTATMTTNAGENNCEPDSSPLEDKEEVVRLYQTSPPHLFPVFNSVLQFCDAADEKDIDYEAVFHVLVEVYNAFNASTADATALAQFVAATDYVAQAVKVLRMAIGAGVIFRSGRNCRDPKAACSRILLGMFHNFTNTEDVIRLRLVKTEIFRDIVECLKILRHISPEIVEEIGICHNFLGILHNSCKNPDVANTVKGMAIVPHLEPFLDKTRSKDVRLSALALLALIVDDTQLGYMELSQEILEYSLCRTKQALESTKPPGRNGWEVEEIACTLAIAARLEFNKRLIVAKDGAIELYKAVLQKGQLQEDIQAALAIFAELATDPSNAKIFQRNKGLVGILSKLQHEECPHQATASKVLAEIQKAECEDEDIEENTALSDVLEDESNTLAILGLGRVEYVIDLLLTVVTSGGSICDYTVTCATLLKALRELAKDESYQREILARGGLALLQKVLQHDRHGDILESCSLLLELACRKEYCILIKAASGLMESVQRLTRHDNQQVRQTALQFVDSIE